jgi:phosphoribosylformylglycinamidine synthase I
MKSAVIIFPGSNCDRDMITTIERVTGHAPHKVWHADSELPQNLDLIALPGGFSYGDYLRSGAISARSPIMGEVIKAAEKGVHILGVCNGFQVLTESGLLPGVLMRNTGLQFICKDEALTVANNSTAFTSGYGSGQKVTFPVAHHDGNYRIDDNGLKSLQDNDQIAFTYDANPNGSVADIAGVFSENKRILGMMPHPERAADSATGGVDGIALFEAMLKQFA